MATLNKAFWNLFKPITGTKRFTLEELRDLYGVLIRNPVVTEANRAVVVETIRSIAEYMIWGDQHEPRLFDFFLENNIMLYLQHVLMQPANRTGEVAKQVLQTLSIIIQNVRSETAVFFLFSNNHINNIVDLDFDFDDDEVLGYYISFLKTISLKLNRGTVQFFINANKDHKGFPLYSRAVQLAHNREGMVRAAVRTLTLHVYSVADPQIQQFVTRPPNSQYFTEVAKYLADQVQLLDRRFMAAESGGGQSLASLDSQLAEVEDVISYISDLLSLGVPAIAQLLASSLWQYVIHPLLLKPLTEPGAAAAAALQQPQHQSVQLSAAMRSDRSGGGGLVAGGIPGGAAHLRHPSWGNGPEGPTVGQQWGSSHVRPVCAVYVLERLFQLVMYPPLLQQLLLALTCTINSNGTNSCVSCRSTLLGILHTGQVYPTTMILRLLVAIFNNRHISLELLTALAILPRKQQQQRGNLGNSSGFDSGNKDTSQLAMLAEAVLLQLQRLKTGESDAVASAAATSSDSNCSSGPTAGLGDRSSGSSSMNLFNLLTQQYLPNKLQSLVDSHTPLDTTPAADVTAANSSNDSSPQQREGMQALEAWLAEAELQAGNHAAATAAAVTDAAGHAFSSLGPQLLVALVHLLQQTALPPSGLRLLGWLLHQLLPMTPVVGDVNIAAASTVAAEQPQHRRQQSAASDTLNSDAVCKTFSVASSSVVDEGTVSDSSSQGCSSDAEEESPAGEEIVPRSHPAPPVSSAPSSIQSCVIQEPRGSVLTEQQQLLLRGAVAAAQVQFYGQLGGMWCEAVFPMLALEWATSREAMQRPVLRAAADALLSGTAVWPLLLELQQQQQVAAAGGAAAPALEGLSESGKAALDCYLAVQRVAAVTQLQELLFSGVISHSPPVPTMTEADLKQVDIQEGYQVDLAPGAAVPCVVSFAPGQERRVYFAVAGLSRRQLAAMQGGAVGQQHSDTLHHPSTAVNNNTSSTAAAADEASAADLQQQQQQHPQATLLRSLPVVVLADPSPSRPQAGIVLSVAPVLGAAPCTDVNVPKWLHVHVRPSVRGLLRVIKAAAAKKGGLLSAMRQLADGHWVLAFPSADKSKAAVQLVQQHAAHLRRLYGGALTPLTGLVQQQVDFAQQQLQQEQQPQQERQEQQADVTAEEQQQHQVQPQVMPVPHQQEEQQEVQHTPAATPAQQEQQQHSSAEQAPQQQQQQQLQSEAVEQKGCGTSPEAVAENEKRHTTEVVQQHELDVQSGGGISQQAPQGQ